MDALALAGGHYTNCMRYDKTHHPDPQLRKLGGLVRSQRIKTFSDVARGTYDLPMTCFVRRKTLKGFSPISKTQVVKTVFATIQHMSDG